MIIASLIEEEAKLDDDRAKISRVIWNRLAAGWMIATEQWGGFFGMPATGTVADVKIVAPGTDTPRHVIVGGRVIVENGALQTGDVEQIRAEAREQAQKLWQRMSEVS